MEMSLMKNKYFVCAFIALLSTQAQAANGTYVTGGFGVTVPSGNTSFTADSSSILYSPTAPGTSLFSLPSVTWKYNYNTGFDINAAIGYQFTDFFRSDVEFVYQNMQRNINGQYNWLERNASTGATYATSNNNPITSKSVTANVYSFLTNAYYDFRNNSKWTPSIGAGIGVAWVNSDTTTAMNTLNVDDPITPLVETAPIRQISPTLGGTAFAAQLKLAVSYKMSEATSLALQYRLFATSQLRSGSSYLITNPGATGESTFYVAQHNVSGLLTNSLELTARLNI